ncbi:thermonuclease family protein [Anabaena subtropica]|uniref:Thermonuclease family protein n=1 Tax=Anabaena subtropica FACHB-260 TaxID=2692884 RepID=A0ABR8CVZ7_9NOST|nr:thermonuclease family protein [Anabaena subtropica]MBD2346392.1 thermonuclease family protein [Anabaena subtropica FACHB-260]
MNKLIKRVLILLSLGIILLCLMGCDNFFGASGDSVERVSDGDTLVVKDAKGNKVTIRFACMDAPEIAHSRKEKQSKRTSDRNQFSWGIKAQERVQQLVKQGGDLVTLNITDSDRYGRKVAEVRLKDGTFVQQVLLQEGLAKVYRPYLNRCPSKEIVQQAEAKAQQQQLGIWGDPQFVNPWEYRRFNK